MYQLCDIYDNDIKKVISQNDGKVTKISLFLSTSSSNVFFSPNITIIFCSQMCDKGSVGANDMALTLPGI